MRYINKILIVFILLLVTNKINAQEYKKDDKIDKFVGRWEWKSGNESLQIVISKQKVYVEKSEFGGGYYTDDAIGWHSYTKNGKVIESSMDKINTKFVNRKDEYGNSTLISGSVRDKFIEFLFKDLTLNKWGHVMLDVIEGKPDELKWRLRYAFDAHTLPDGENENYTLPKDLILKRVLITVPWQ